MTPLYKIIKNMNNHIFILVALLISPMAFAAFDVYVPSGAIYKADMINNQLLLVGRDGKKTQAPDGFYMTAEGKKYKVEKGLTVPVESKKKQAASAEQKTIEKSLPAKEAQKTDSRSASANKQSTNKSIVLNEGKKNNTQQSQSQPKIKNTP